MLNSLKPIHAAIFPLGPRLSKKGFSSLRRAATSSSVYFLNTFLSLPDEPRQAAAKEIAAAVEKGKQTEAEINVARELYRKQATEGAMLYFLLTKL